MMRLDGNPAQLTATIMAAMALFAAGAVTAETIDLSERRGVQEMVVSVKFLDRSIENGMVQRLQFVHFPYQFIHCRLN